MNELTNPKDSESRNLVEFFSKEIKNINFGHCYSFYDPCYHPNVKIEYEDGDIKYFELDGSDIHYLCKKFDKKLPYHFLYMNDSKYSHRWLSDEDDVESEFSDLNEFFCKEIKDIDEGTCMQISPCQHSDVKVIYEDDSVKHFKYDS